MNKNSKIYVAGHTGLVGSAILRRLTQDGYTNIITSLRPATDLTKQIDVYSFFEKERPEYVFLAAAKVGGLFYNKKYPADFLRDNLLIQTNVIDAAYQFGCKKLVFIGSACVYPKDAPQPLKEEYFMTGELEPTNISYAMSKMTGYLLCSKYNEQYGFNCISVMPNNLYGINDNFTLDGHVIPSQIYKFFEAKKNNQPSITCFGDGSPKREFTHSDDLADCLLFLMHTYNSPDMINVGGEEIEIKSLSEMISSKVGYQGSIFWDTTKPNGVARRVLDSTNIKNLGWQPQISLEKGITNTIGWYKKCHGY